MGIQSLVETIKSKIGLLKKKKHKKKKHYVKLNKSSSFKIQIRRKKMRELIDQTLEVADEPGKRTLS